MKYVVQPHEHIIPNVSAITLHYLIVFGHGQYLSISTCLFFMCNAFIMQNLECLFLHKWSIRLRV